MGRWAGAFGNVVDKKHVPPPLGTKMTDPPLKQGVGSCITHPLVKTWMFGFLLIIQ